MKNDGKDEDRVRVLLADDHAMLREGLATLLRTEKDIEVVGEAENGMVALELARAMKPQVVVMDVTMPVLSGLEATRRIVRELPGTRVVGLSMHSERDMAKAMREAGASAFLSKGCPIEELLAAIRGCVARDAE